MTAFAGVDWPSWMRRIFGLVLRIDHVDVIALLISQHRSARNCKHRDRMHAFEHHGDEFSVGQFAERSAGIGAVESRGFGMTPRRVSVSVFSAMVGDT